MSQVSFLLKLGPENILWENLKSETRTKIRKSWKYNLQIKEGREYLKDFYPLYQRVMHKRGSPAHGYQFFKNVVEEFQDKAKIFIAEHNDVPVAGQINIQFEDRLANLWTASDYSCAWMRPNDFLYWEVIKWAIKNDFKYFDFGRSPKDSGIYRFKKQWGGEEKPFFHHRYLSPSGKRLVPRITQSKWISAIWKLVPLPIAKRLGPFLRKYLT